MAIYNGPAVDMHPRNLVKPNLPEWYREANKGYRMDADASHSGAPEMASAIIAGLIANGVDIAVSSEVKDAHQAGFGHAYGFVFERLLGDRNIPCVPVLLNTYYPPNVPTPARCFEVGQKMRAAIEAAPGEARVAVIASGGLTHFVTDEAFDRSLMRAFETGDADALSAVPVNALRSGNSEILNWIMAAGALEELRVSWSDYIPVRRTPAGTGIGLGFAVWS